VRWTVTLRFKVDRLTSGTIKVTIVFVRPAPVLKPVRA